ncbi:hypothetical protein Tco_1254858 [Tanacetum coccineum]
MGKVEDGIVKFLDWVKYSSNKGLNRKSNSCSNRASVFAGEPALKLKGHHVILGVQPDDVVYEDDPWADWKYMVLMVRVSCNVHNCGADEPVHTMKEDAVRVVCSLELECHS